MANLQEIADRAGVSLNTASRILSGQVKGTRRDAVVRSALVMKIAQELNYRPNSFAQAIRRGRFGGIALLLSTDRHRSHIPAGLLEGIEGALRDQDLHLTITSLPDDTLTQQGSIPKILRQAMADGLLINYTDHIPEQMIDLIAKNGIPSVWLNSDRPEDCVRPDDEGAARLATETLIQKGHRKIVYVDYHHDHSLESVHYSAAARYLGYCRAMDAAGFKPVGVWENRKLSPAERIELASKWLCQPNRPSAVVAYSPMTAGPMFLAAMTRCDLRVPEDLSIVTFSDVVFDDLGKVVSTMLLPEQALGRTAVEMLLKKILEPFEKFATRRIPFIFDEGETIVPPR